MYNNMNKAYVDIISRLMTNGDHVYGTKELRNFTFTLNNIDQNIIGARDISLKYLIGELVWYFKGSNDMEFISKFGSLWERISDDGVTSNSAYGYVLQEQEGFNQIEKIIELLIEDPHSRRAVLNINRANENVIETKDEPCTIALQLIIRDNKLHMTGIMRSNDIWFGLPYDVAFFTTLQKYIADRLGIEYGTYTHFATSLHVYERDMGKLGKVIRNYNQKFQPDYDIDHVKLINKVDELYEYIENEGTDLLVSECFKAGMISKTVYV